MKILAPALSFLFLISCSGFKLDTSANCLNEASGCFKFDKTAPTLVSSVPAPAQIVSVLTEIDLTFSEELNNPQPSDFILNSPGNGLRIGSVQKIAAFTYRLVLDQTSVQNGAIAVNYSNVKDYNNNKANGTLLFTGNVDIGITFVTELADNPLYRKGVSNGGGYTTTQIQFYHDYGTDNNNAWQIRVSTGAVDCTAGTQYFSGTGLLSGVANKVSQTLDRLTHFAPGAGSYRVIVCIENAAMNKRGTGSLLIVRDDTPPSVNHSPLSDEYNSQKTITFTCNDQKDKIIYRSTEQSAWTGNALPADPADPDFDADGVPLAGSTLVEDAAVVVTPNPVNPTRSKFKHRCIDIAGNKSAIQMANYVVDTTLPEVNISLASGYRQFVTTASGGYQTTQINFTTNQIAGLDYRIVKGATSCASEDGTSIIGGTQVTLAQGQLHQHTINASEFTVGSNDIRICVRNAANTKWGTASLQITRDDTVPTVSPSVASGTYGTVQQVQLTCAGNYDKVAYTYTTANGLAVPAEPDEPTFDAITGNILLGTLHSGPFATPDISTTKLRYKCLSKSGLQSVATTESYIVDSILPTVNIISNTNDFVSNNTGAFNFTDLTFQVSRAGLNYDIKEGSTNCTGGNVLATGSIPAANQNITVRLNTPIAGPPNHFTSAQTYSIKICVANYIGTLGYSVISKQIVRDDTPPSAVSGLVITSTGSGSYTLNWTAATDANGISGYRIFRASTSNGYGAHNYTSTTNSVNISGLNDADTYFFAVKAVDSAGNLSATFSNEVRNRLNLRVNVTGMGASAGAFKVQSGSETLNFFASGTQQFTTVFTPGASYSLSITEQKPAEHCAFLQNMSGIINSEITLDAVCMPGYFAGSGMVEYQPVDQKFNLQRGKVAFYTPTFDHGHGIVHVNGYVYTTEYYTHQIKRLNLADGTVQVIAGTGTAGSNDGDGATATFNTPNAITSDGIFLYVAQITNPLIRRIRMAAPYTVTTIAGAGIDGAPCPGEAQASCRDGGAFNGSFSKANSLHYHNGYLYFPDYHNHRIRRFNLTTRQFQTLAGTGAEGDTDGTGNSATLRNPGGLTIVGNALYFTEVTGHRVRRMYLTSPYHVTTIAGSITPGKDDGPAANSTFNSPNNITTDNTDLYLSDMGNGKIRKIDLTKSIVSTIAGKSTGYDYPGVGPIAELNGPVGITMDNRRIYVMTHHATGKLWSITNLGLKGYWPLPFGNLADYNSDGSTLNNAELVGTPTDASQIDRFSNAGAAMYFSGTEYLRANDSNLPTGTAERTICAWVTASASMTGWRSIVSTGTNGATGASFSLSYESDDKKVTLRGHNADLSVNYVLPTSYTHLCIAYAGGANAKASVYIQGRKMAETNMNLNTGATTYMYIGNWVNAGAEYWVGAISDVRVYDRLLNEGEIHELAQNVNSSETANDASTGPTHLLAHYALNNTSSSGPLGGTLGGTLNLVTGKDGDTGGAIHLTGNSSHQANSTTGLPEGKSHRTMCAFISPASYPVNNFNYAVSYGALAGFSGFGLAIRNISNTTYVANTFSSGSDNLYAYTPPLNAWTHLCATYNGTTSVLYLNGTAVSTQAANLTTSLTNFRIGAWIDDSQKFHGKVDDVRIYARALTAEQIRQIATQVPTGLIFRIGSEVNAEDVSGFNHRQTSNASEPVAGRTGISNTAFRFIGGKTVDFQDNTHLRLARDATWSFWLKSPNISGSPPAGSLNGEIISKYNASSGWIIKYDQSNFAHAWSFSNPPSLSAYATSLKVNADNVWNHLAYVKSGNNLTIYYNGRPITNNQSGDGGRMNSNALDMKIGLAGSGDIILEDIRIYSRALASGEVMALSGYHLAQTGDSLRLHLQADTFSNQSDDTFISKDWIDSAIAPYNSARAGTYTGTTNDIKYLKESSGMPLGSGVLFEGTGNQHFAFGNGDSITYSGLGLCAVVIRKGAMFEGIIERRSGTHSDSWAMMNDAGNSLKFEMNASGGNPSVSSAIDEKPAIYCVNHTNDTIYSNLNGSAGPTAANLLLVGASSQPLVVGYRYNSAGQFRGIISELAHWTKDLSADDLKIAQCYLSSKYGIALDNNLICP